MTTFVMLKIVLVILAVGGQPAVSNFRHIVVPSRGEVWPAPQKQTFHKETYTVNPIQLELKITHFSCADLKEAVKRFKSTLHQMVESHRWVINQSENKSKMNKEFPTFSGVVEIILEHKCDDVNVPQYHSNENYTIKVNHMEYQHRAAVISSSLWGIYHGLETFIQLMYFSPEEQKFHLRQGHIEDFPRYSHRGLLLDTSRHYLSVKTIKTQLDLMAQNKFNVFHWHLVDDQSFPFVSTTYPNMSVQGAYAPHLIYDEKSVDDIVEYARLRGIRVLPEFDTPGHTKSWGKGHPGLLTTCYNDTTSEPDGSYGAIDPTNYFNIQMVTSLLDEVKQRFPDRYIHLGGDEVEFDFKCWLSNPAIRQWMSDNGMNRSEEIVEYYIEELAKNLPKERHYIFWQEVFDEGITGRISLLNPVVHVWKRHWQSTMALATGNNLSVILSSCWYLNYISYGIDWPKLYRCDPANFFGSPQQKDLVMGGEACMWGEYVDDTNIVTRTWPRASLVAERLWSDKSVHSVQRAQPRIEEHRCRMLRRGYQVEPINGPGFCQ